MRRYLNSISMLICVVNALTCSGEKLTDEEVDQIFAGLEDDNGNVQYDGE